MVKKEKTKKRRPKLSAEQRLTGRVCLWKNHRLVFVCKTFETGNAAMASVVFVDGPNLRIKGALPKDLKLIRVGSKEANNFIASLFNFITTFFIMP